MWTFSKNKIDYLLLLLVLGGVAALYYPGLGSYFVFDDYYNLVELELIKTKGILYYLFSGPAGPGGRPLATLSFALQYQDWPANPFAFKLVNLLIHGLNGILIFIVSGQLGRYLRLNKGEVRALALLTAALWLLHPVHVNTVVYVVQRMTEISCFFTLAGIAGYLNGRRRYEEGSIRPGFIIMSLSIVIGTVLAFLGKENGALLPLYILVIESTILASSVKNRDWRRWSWVFIGIPLIAITVYFVMDFSDIIKGYRHREFTLSERLLTEAVILLVYLKYIIVPNPDDFSFYHDAFPVSSGLFLPGYTFVAVGLILFLLVFSIAGARKYRVFSFAVLWFFSGHILESTFIPLELFFEHRNYLPAFGICFLLAWSVVKIRHYISLKWPVWIFTGTYLIFLVAIAFMVIHLWANPMKQAVVWSRINPDSVRVTHNLANLYIVRGDYEGAKQVLDNMNSRYPDEIYPEVKNIMLTYCLEKNSLMESDWSRVYEAARTARPHGFAIVAEIDSIISGIQEDKCRMNDIPRFMRFILTLAENPEFSRFQATFHEFLSLLAIEIHEGRAALANIREANRLRPMPHRLILETKILIGMGKNMEAREKLTEIKDYLIDKPRYYLANKAEIDQLEKRLEKAE